MIQLETDVQRCREFEDKKDLLPVHWFTGNNLPLDVWTPAPEPRTTWLFSGYKKKVIKK